MPWSRQKFERKFLSGLPEELAKLQVDVEKVAASHGLDFPPIHYELLDYREMSMLAAYGGFPVRYPHWRFGMEYNQLHKGYTYGLQKIYEMVINTDPVVGYLMSSNPLTDQKLVMAHVCAHADFFKNNLWFAHTNRKMIDEMANHATRVRRYIDRYGQERVEEFLDVCLSLENLIDRNAPGVRRHAAGTLFEAPTDDDLDMDDSQEIPVRRMKDGDEFRLQTGRSYMEPYINPRDEIRRQQQAAWEEERARSGGLRLPLEPEQDVLLFLLEHAPLRAWQADVLSIVREEAYYFAPQGQTKICNEGWATFWHSKLMTGELATDAEIIEYADHHSGTVFMAPGSLNPYKLGVELLHDIEDRWNKGRHGAEYDACDDMQARNNWDTGEMKGLEKVFEVRQIYNDLTFVDAFLTEDFCRRYGFFTYGYDPKNRMYVIESREFAKIKQQLLYMLTNSGQPRITVVDGNYRNRGEMLLEHDFDGGEIDLGYAERTMRNLCHVWSRPVAIRTVLGDKRMILSHDGETFEQREEGKGKGKGDGEEKKEEATDAS
jgi:stage V sporulation protein R